MAGAESLDELSNDITEAYNDELQKSQTVEESKNEDPNSTVITKLRVLESWKSLVTSLCEKKVFLRYIDQLEKLFFSCNFLGGERYGDIKMCVDCLIETVGDHTETGATVRYVTIAEILGSVTSHWEFSACCEEIWTDHDIPQVTYCQNSNNGAEFRREAYQVLLGLDWEPPKSLADLCSHQDPALRQQGGESLAPQVVRSIFNQIRSTPLPRNDNIHRLLDKLQDGIENVTIAIASRSRYGQGLGKTTLAAMVTSYPHVQSAFTVLWLRLDHDQFNYEVYLKYLDTLCEQLNETPNWPTVIHTLEEPSLQTMRQDERMFQIKREMTRIIGSHTHKPLLMILDDVKNDQEIEWFWFKSRQSMLVTTLSPSLAVDWTLELEPLSEEEALELFLTEADYPSTHVLRTSLEARSIVHQCAFHPLCIRTAARWFRLKQVTAGVVKGLEELNHELSACMANVREDTGRKSIPASKVLFEIMEQMLSPVLADGEPTSLMKLCLASMVTVFPKAVPLEAVHLLWAKLLTTEESALDELGDGLSASQIRKRVRFISEALSSLGILHILETEDKHRTVEVHHDLQKEYALEVASDFEPNSFCRWHEAFASSYLKRKIATDREGSQDVCRSYALQHLVQHMLKAEMFKKVAILLKDERFLVERLDEIGFEKGIKLQIEDTARLEESMQNRADLRADPEEVAVNILSKIGSFVSYHCGIKGEEYVREGTKSLYLVGCALAERKRYQEALSQFKIALKMTPKASSPFASTILYTISGTYLACCDNQKALKHLEECLQVVNERGESNILYSEVLMLMGDALRTECEYMQAMEYYDFALEKLYAHSTNNRVEIGIGLGRKGRLHLAIGDTKKAQEVLEECRDWKLKIGEHSLDLASVYNLLGDVLMEDDDKDGALECFDKAYRLYEGNEESLHQTDLHILNGKVDALSDEIEGCCDNFELAVQSLSGQKRPMMEQDAYDLRIISRTYDGIDEDQAALETFMVALQQTLEKKEASLERAATLCDLGNFHAKKKDAAGALACFQESLQIRTTKVGDSEIVVETLLRLGWIHRTNNELDESLKFLNKALEMSEGVYGEKSEQVSDILWHIADAKLDMNEIADAMAMFEECLDNRRRIHFVKSHPDIAEALEGLGNVYIKQNNWERAYQNFAEALNIRQASMELDDPAVAATLHKLGVIARNGGDCDRAMSFLLEALQIRKLFDTVDDTVVTLTEIGHVHRSLGDADSALGCYHKCMEMVVERYSGDHEMMADVCLPLGHLHKEMGSVQEASTCYEQALKVRKVKLGVNDLKTAAAFRSLGILQFEVANYDEALKNLENFIRIQEAKKMKNTVDFVLALQLAGDIHKFYSKTDEATSAYSAAFHTYSQNRDLPKKYPQFRSLLERRLITEAEPTDEAVRVSSGILSMMVGRLEDEVQTTGGTIESTPEEINLRRSIIFFE